MAVKFRDYYEILGVSKTASQDEIRKAFRKLARQHHPDVSKEKASAEEKFKEINEAYEVLSDEEKRQKYDQLGANWNQPGGYQTPPGWEGAPGSRGGGGSFAGGDFEFGGTGFSDFFEMFFGSRRGGGGRPGGGGFDFGGYGGGRPGVARGEDLTADLMVTMEEALRGGKRSVSFRRSGSSKVETYDVKIPAAVYEGQRIRLKGQGEAGIGGGESGDLFLRVRIAQHPEFEREEADLYYDLEVTAPEAVLGGEFQVPTLDGGNAKLNIQPGTQGNQKLRLRGRGLPKNGGGRGDLYVVVSINIPKELSPAQRELWTKLRELDTSH